MSRIGFAAAVEPSIRVIDMNVAGAGMKLGTPLGQERNTATTIDTRRHNISEDLLGPNIAILGQRPGVVVS